MMRREEADAVHTVQYTLVPRHDNYACTLCLTTCLLMWMISAVGLGTAYAVVYSTPNSCGVACLADRSYQYHSCAWLGRLECYDGVDDGVCASCAPPTNLSLAEQTSFHVCCPHHPMSTAM